MSEQTCVHHWLCGQMVGGLTPGVCKRCGAERVFRYEEPGFDIGIDLPGSQRGASWRELATARKERRDRDAVASKTGGAASANNRRQEVLDRMEARRARVLELAKQGHGPGESAELLGLARATVAHDWAALREQGRLAIPKAPGKRRRAWGSISADEGRAAAVALIEEERAALRGGAA